MEKLLSLFVSWKEVGRERPPPCCGGARAFASSLVRSRNEGPEGQDGPAPDLADLLARS